MSKSCEVKGERLPWSAAQGSEGHVEMSIPGYVGLKTMCGNKLVVLPRHRLGSTCSRLVQRWGFLSTWDPPLGGHKLPHSRKARAVL